MKNMKKVAEAKKPKVVFESSKYSISSVPLNFRIDINPSLKPQNPNSGMDMDCYSDLDKGLEKAHAVAQLIINKYFVRGPLGGTFANRKEV